MNRENEGPSTPDPRTQDKNDKKNGKRTDPVEIEREKISTILTPYWNRADGERNDFTLAIACFLKRLGETQEDAEAVISSLCENTGKGSDHIAGVKYAFNRDGPVKGFTSLSKMMVSLSKGSEIETEKDVKELKKMMKREQKEPESDPFPEELRSALRTLNANDEDGATKKNGVGFNRKDGPIAKGLLTKDEWDDQDVDVAYDIAKHYKKTQLEDRWEGIEGSRKAYQKERKERKWTKKPEGLWTPIELKDGFPVAYAGWHEGMPYTLKIIETSMGLIEVMHKITLRNHDGLPIQNSINRIRLSDGKDAIEFHGEVFAKADFVSIMVYPTNVNAFTECLNSLPINDGIFREPKFYLDGNHIMFPDLFYAKRDDSYQRILKDALQKGKVNQAFYDEGITLLKKYPKQLTLCYAIYGANIVNFLAINDFPITIDAIGERDTGKSFSIVLSLKLGYGIGEAILQDDAINSSFRHHAIANSTNLPIYVEEANMGWDNLSKLKSRAKNIRGNADKSLTSYDTLSTWIFSRNSERQEDLPDPTEREAQRKRIYKFIFEKEDVVPDETRAIGKNFLNKIQGEPGGLIYEKLKDKNTTEIREKYFDLIKEHRDGRVVVSLLGAWIMGDTEFFPTVCQEREPDVLDSFFGKIISASHRIDFIALDHNGYPDSANTTQEDKQLQGELTYDSKNGEFKITVTGFELIRKYLRTGQSARNFAKTFKFPYKTISIHGNKSMGIVGTIPKKFREGEEDGINKVLDRESTEEEKLDDMLG